MTSHRISPSPLAAVLLAGALLMAPAVAHAAPLPAAAAPPGGCTSTTGVTVVVDFTDLGGDVEVGCAETAATGTEALAAAGFVEGRDPSGFICSVDALPDPCPTEFTGSYWTYWNAEPGGEWQFYSEGPDTAVPVPGAVEGWRYGTGDAGPTIAAPAPAAAPVEEPATEEPTEEPTEAPAEDEAQDGAADDGASVTQAEQEPAADDAGPSQSLLAGVGLLAVLALAAVLLARRRSSISRGDGPRGQD